MTRYFKCNLYDMFGNLCLRYSVICVKMFIHSCSVFAILCNLFLDCSVLYI